MLYNRTKDFDDGKATPLAASTVSDPWFKTIVPNVSHSRFLRNELFPEPCIVQEDTQRSITRGL